MYIPSETIYHEVVSDEETISYMIEKKVVPASPIIELYKTLGNHIKNVSSKYNETLQKLESIKDLIRIITKNFTNL